MYFYPLIMGKNKLRRFAENLEFPHLLQPKLEFPLQDQPMKGNWHKEFFKNNDPIVLELGCGRGEYTVNLAERFPDKNFIGIDWKGARLWKGAKDSFTTGMKNVGFLRIQIQTISAFFAENEVEEIWITFPDPQLQQSRIRKRLTSPRFLDLYRKFLKKDGVINLKTDSRPLYDYTLEVIAEQGLKIHKQTDNLYASPLADEILSIKTTYEKMWLKEGLPICYVQFEL
jgi:tRNA (guanine-N7-)-methyltransferase